MTTPAIQGTQGRRPSIPTEPAVPPGAVKAAHYGEGTGAAQSFRQENSKIWEREVNNHYVEPHWVARRLFEVERFSGTIVDPCCGFGRIPIAARAVGHESYGMDLIDRGFDYLSVCNFLTSDIRADNYVFNPPFELGDQFALHALRLVSRKVAMIFPTRRLNACHWIKGTPLYRIYYLTPRPSMPPGEVAKAHELKGTNPTGGKQDFCILVWLKGFEGEPSVRWLHRDGDKATAAPSTTDRPFGAPL